MQIPDSYIESKHCILINEGGRRFADETTGDEITNQYLAKQEKRREFFIVRVGKCSLKQNDDLTYPSFLARKPASDTAWVHCSPMGVTLIVCKKRATMVVMWAGHQR
jgi:hypothetical protein